MANWPRQISIGMNILGLGGHGAAWRTGESPDAFPSGAEIFVDEVVPLLRKRGVFRTEYTGTTLRDHLGLSSPTSQYATRLKVASA